MKKILLIISFIFFCMKISLAGWPTATPTGTARTDFNDAKDIYGVEHSTVHGYHKDVRVEGTFQTGVSTSNPQFIINSSSITISTATKMNADLNMGNNEITDVSKITASTGVFNYISASTMSVDNLSVSTGTFDHIYVSSISGRSPVNFLTDINLWSNQINFTSTSFPYLHSYIDWHEGDGILRIEVYLDPLNLISKQITFNKSDEYGYDNKIVLYSPLYMIPLDLNVTTGFNAFNIDLTKTAGITDIDDHFKGIYIRWDIDDPDAEHGNFYGADVEVKLSSGVIGSTTTNRFLGGSKFKAIVTSGTVYGDVWGGGSEVYIGSSATVAGDVYGHVTTVDVDGTSTGTVYGNYIQCQDGVDYGLYIVNTSTQLRLHWSANSYADFVMDAGGYLNIAPLDNLRLQAAEIVFAWKDDITRYAEIVPEDKTFKPFNAGWELGSDSYRWSMYYGNDIDLTYGITAATGVFTGITTSTITFTDGTFLTSTTTLCDGGFVSTADADLNMAGFGIVDISSITGGGSPIVVQDQIVVDGVQLGTGDLDTTDNAITTTVTEGVLISTNVDMTGYLFNGLGDVSINDNVDFNSKNIYGIDKGTFNHIWVSSITGDSPLYVTTEIRPNGIKMMTGDIDLTDNALTTSVTDSILISTHVTVTGQILPDGIQLQTGDLDVTDNAITTTATDAILIATNVYITGYSSATAYYGDGSALTAGDSTLFGSFDPTHFIDTTTAQSIDGKKTFNHEVTVSSNIIISGNLEFATNRIIKDSATAYAIESSTDILAPEVITTYGFYHDRGDPTTNDYILSVSTEDGNWNDLDLSAIIPTDTKAVKLFVLYNASAINKIAQFRKNGNSNEFNRVIIISQVANQTISSDIVVACDTNRIIEYKLSSPETTAFEIVICGWWK